ncbi:hypothetical protein C5B85_16425 [Pseudoclavibacter sp. AY1F1]|uniref:hypothetical protein n=1 Tax=Pseudoclavibacter sp. AY1F1 TaxID=2080583 RepID=UPI000CE85FC9|nr:hypothetical protein [Pseudoclavibacter sp. AY1F1]PPF42351.1 hypothetical protein C5B85_16425 [Pseudoclavibacter sp. AY1F1]
MRHSRPRALLASIRVTLAFIATLWNSLLLLAISLASLARTRTRTGDASAYLEKIVRNAKVIDSELSPTASPAAIGTSRRIVLWGLSAPCLAGPLAFAPIGLVGWGLEGLLVRPALTLIFGIDPTGWQGLLPMPEALNLLLGAALGTALIALGYAVAPAWLDASHRVSRWLLAEAAPASRSDN